MQKQLRIENNILTKNGLFVIPKTLRPFIVQELHKGIRPGGAKLYKLIQTRLYRPNLFRYVRNHIKVCEVCKVCKVCEVCEVCKVCKVCETCQQCKPCVHPPKAPLLPISEPTW